VGITSQYAKFNQLTGLMSGRVRFTAFVYRAELMRGTIRMQECLSVPGVLTVTIY